MADLMPMRIVTATATEPDTTTSRKLKQQQHQTTNMSRTYTNDCNALV